jgi:hypothetical protein
MKNAIVTLLLDESDKNGSVDVAIPIEEPASVVTDRLASYCGMADSGYVIEFCNPYGEWYKVDPVYRLMDVGVMNGYYIRLRKNSSILSAPLLKTDLVGWHAAAKRVEPSAEPQQISNSQARSGFVFVPLD